MAKAPFPPKKAPKGDRNPKESPRHEKSEPLSERIKEYGPSGKPPKPRRK